MTRVWVAVGIFAAIIVLATTEYRLTIGTADKVIDVLEQTEISAKESSEQTEKLCGDIKKLWNEKKDYLAMFLSHEEIDRINISIDKLTRLSKQHNFEEVDIECGTLANYIESLKEAEKVDFHNIL